MTRVIRTINNRKIQYLGNKLQGDYDTSTSEYYSKPRYRGIDGVHVGVKLLNVHTGTLLGYLT